VILMLKAVSDQHESGSKERLNDGAKENQGPHQIKRLGLDPLNELSHDTGKGSAAPFGEDAAA
jgi:hypothetical protein